MKKLVAILSIIAVLGILVCILCACNSEETGDDVVSGLWTYRPYKAKVDNTDTKTIESYLAKGYEIVETGDKQTELVMYALTAYSGNDSVVVVPAEVDGHKIACLDNGLFIKTVSKSESRRLRDTYCANETLAEVIISEGILEIKPMAFYLCTKLSQISIPASVTSIGDFAFYNCTSLESIDIPSSVENIGAYAFFQCSGLKQVNLSVKEGREFPPKIGEKCFYLLDEKADDEDMYYVIPDLKIIVDNADTFVVSEIKAAFKANKNNDYRNWNVYIGYKDDKGKLLPCYMYKYAANGEDLVALRVDE